MRAQSSFSFSSGDDFDMDRYVDLLMKRRPESKYGVISLSKAHFRDLINKASTEQHFKSLNDAYYNFIGHRNLMPQTVIDEMMVKALELGHPAAVQDMIKYHEEFLYHPCPEKVLTPYLNHYVEHGDLE